MEEALKMFQFLIGTLKTAYSGTVPACAITVSIPYRYAKNYKAPPAADPNDKFQFLIGTLKTQLMVLTEVSGTLVSIPYRYAKNLNYIRKVIEKSAVSIPYRYAKNSWRRHADHANN